MSTDTSKYTTAVALLDALESAGVTHLFVNLGSDHPALLEAMSLRKQNNNNGIRFLTAPNEFVGVCAAQGFYQISGNMAAILVHVDVGTMAMGGSVHNVSRNRVPVLMLAGTSPVTEEGELLGTRNVGFLDTTARGINWTNACVGVYSLSAGHEGPARGYQRLYGV